MFTHVRIGTNDVAKARAFYDAVLAPFDLAGQEMGAGVSYGSFGSGMFMVGPAREGVASHANGGTIGFQAPDRDAVDAFHAAGLANGGSDEGAPGVREGFGIYAAYLRDPDGNKICAIAPAG
jgi:catechol 2,3-dioxygenase-like lactoylglutathione lyase family enzyme